MKKEELVSRAELAIRRLPDGPSPLITDALASAKKGDVEAMHFLWIMFVAEQVVEEVSSK